MYVKHLIGSHKGDIEDLPFEIAKEKVLRGEAEDVYEQLPRKAKPVSAVMQPKIESNRVDAVAVGAKRAKKR